MKCWKYIGVSLFFLMSCLLSLYIIAFGEVAVASVEMNWLTCAGSSLLIDLIIF